MASLYPDIVANGTTDPPRTIRDIFARDGFQRSVNAHDPSSINHSFQSINKPKSSEITVGIVGAGCAGLYSAMILKSLNIKFEILEGSDRIGGRVFTHHFSSASHDYFDVGAMRFPRLWFMRQLTVTLFDKLGLQSKVVPYYMQPRYDMPNTCLYYNKKQYSGPKEPEDRNYFKIAQDPSLVDPGDNGNVPADYVRVGAENLLLATFEPILSIFRAINDNKATDEERLAALTRAQEIMRYMDSFSTRGFLKHWGRLPATILQVGDTRVDPDDVLKFYLDSIFGKECGYSPAVIQWLETTTTGTTGWYDMGVTQTLMELADFGDQSLGEGSWRPEGSPIKNFDWVCLDGGSEGITKGMMTYLGLQAEGLINKRVTSITQSEADPKLTVSVAGQADKLYDQVICTATLGCMATMELGDCLSYAQNVAIRCLQYDASCKIGVKFTKRWWQDRSFMNEKPIYGGVSKSDLPLSNVVYPSYGEADDPNSSGVLICSYTWAQDAKRLGSLIGQGGKMSPELEDLVVRDLAKIHSVSEVDLRKMIVDSFTYAWGNDPFYRGAFAIFGPSQFFDTDPKDQNKAGGASLFDSVKLPGAKGRLHIAGEATSTHHGWIIGALNSAWRAVDHVLQGLSDGADLRVKLAEEWEAPDEQLDSKVAHIGYRLGAHGRF